jgi:hypothetical protein
MTEARHTLIVPVMKARVPVDLRLEFPLPPDEEPIREPFVADLYLSYAFDLPVQEADTGRRHGQYVTRRYCAETGLLPEALRQQSTANLRTRRPDLGFAWYPDAKAVSVSLGGGLEAGLLLDDAMMEKLTQDVDGDVVVAVPARNVLVATGTGHPDGLAKLHWIVDQVWSGIEERALLLTRDLLVRRPAGWESYA